MMIVMHLVEAWRPASRVAAHTHERWKSDMKSPKHTGHCGYLTSSFSAYRHQLRHDSSGTSLPSRSSLPMTNQLSISLPLGSFLTKN